MATSGKHEAANGGALGALPEWDLADLYSGPEAPDLAADLERTEKAAKGFRARYQDKLAGLPGAALAEALVLYEDLQETLGRVMSYAQLV